MDNQMRTAFLFSSLWIFVFLNMLIRDVHEFIRPGFLQEVMTGVINGTPITPELLTVAALVLQIPLAMIALSPLLSLRSMRWANGVAAVIFGLLLITSDRNDMDDIVHAVSQMIALGMIAVFALHPSMISRTAIAAE